MKEVLTRLVQFVSEEYAKLLEQTLVHSGLTFLSLFLAILISVPAGIWISRRQKLAAPVLGIAGVLQTIPSIALLGFLIPVLGIGAKPAIVALFIYALLPIIRNTYTGIQEIDSAVKEAARAMGMTRTQVLTKVELPLAFPVILAGIRTATVINVGVATLAAYIAAGGLGEFIFGGIALNNSAMILTGAIPAALLAILFDFLLSRLQHIAFKKVKPVLVTAVILFVAVSSLYFVPTVFGSKLLAGFDPEFMGRKDGYPGLRDVYGLKMSTVVVKDAVMYKAIKENQVDVIGGYSTDGRIKAYGLKILEDDKHVFPPYYAAPVARSDILERFPHLENVLNMLVGKITDSVMAEMNYKVDILHQSPEEAAREFLKQVNLYREPSGNRNGVVRIGSKVFSEQYTLVEIYKMLIKGHTELDVTTSTGLGGTKIVFDALTHDQIDFYPEYTGTGLQVILQAPDSIINRMIKDKDAVFTYVKDEFLEKYQLKWLRPIGFNNTYALMLRAKEADKLNIKTITDLKQYLER